jgi:F0F1-type ATP synthase membrane subunit c/vacuolar-type H+-ATPase subunit K
MFRCSQTSRGLPSGLAAVTNEDGIQKMKKLVAMLVTVTIAGCGGGVGDVGSDAIQAARKTPQGGPKSQNTAFASTTSATTTQVGPPLGVNLEALTDWARLPPFVDLMKTSRVWGTADAPWTETSAVDVLGWPTGDAGVVVALTETDEGDAPRYLAAGTYRLSFTGKATVALISSAGVALTNSAYDQATNRSTADLVVSPTSTQLTLSFRNTSGGVKNVSIRRPGYSETETFTNEFKQAVAPFRVLRLMDYLATNQTRVASWTDRTTPASATQASIKGGSYEYAIQMANELGKDIWINIPHNADDAYIRSLADLLNRTLSPDRTVYLEYSNEVWNWMFPQATDNLKMAIAEAVAGDTSLTDGTPCTQAQFDAENVSQCNKYWAGFYRVGKRITRISQIFSEVMGAAAFNTRYRPVYATQWAYKTMGEQVLKNMAKYRGAPASYLYAIAGAPYFTLPTEQYTSTTLTADAILQGLQNYVDVHDVPDFKTGMFVNGAFSPGTPYNGGNYTQATQKALADYYKIKSVAYEGGLDLGQSPASALAKMQANKDSRMGDIVKGELDQWFGCGNDLYMYFGLTSAWGQWGYWGLTNDPNNLNLPRYVAAQKVAQTPAANFTTCR